VGFPQLSQARAVRGEFAIGTNAQNSDTDCQRDAGSKGAIERCAAPLPDTYVSIPNNFHERICSAMNISPGSTKAIWIWRTLRAESDTQSEVP